MRTLLVSLALLFAAAGVDGAEAPKTKALLDALVARENDLWTTFQKRDAAGFKALVTRDFLMIDPAGITDAAAQVASMADYAITDFALDGFRLQQPAPATAVLAYHAVTHYTYKGQAAAMELDASSVWVERKGAWVLAFHQDTPLPPKPAAPATPAHP